MMGTNELPRPPRLPRPRLERLRAAVTLLCVACVPALGVALIWLGSKP